MDQEENIPALLAEHMLNTLQVEATESFNILMKDILANMNTGGDWTDDLHRRMMHIAEHAYVSGWCAGVTKFITGK